MKIIYALKEINTGLFYSQKYKDIVELSIMTKFFGTKKEAYQYKKNKGPYGISLPVILTSFSAIEKMYDKPLYDIDEITEDMLRDTASLFKFKVVPIEIKEI